MYKKKKKIKKKKGFKLLNDDDYRLTLNAVRSVLYQKSSLIDSSK